MRVCVPSQTISVMTTTGKSALRRKRFTKLLETGYQCPDPPTRGPRAGLRQGRRVEYGDVREIPVPLAEIEPVPDHELVRDLEARIADGDVDLPPRRLRQQGADLERSRVARLEVPDQVREREARVDDVLDDEDVPALDVD